MRWIADLKNQHDFTKLVRKQDLPGKQIQAGMNPRDTVHWI